MDMMHGNPWVKPQSGALYCWEGSGDSLKITKKLDGVSVSNGIVWNRAGDTMWYIDTPTLQVDAFDFDGATGEISNRRCAIRFPARDTEGFHGFPDGSAIADDDTIFIACWAGNCVVRYNPYTGELIKKYVVPEALNITSCAFGGANLDQLFITSAGAGNDDLIWASDNKGNAGSLFKIDLSGEGIRSLPSNSYRL